MENQPRADPGEQDPAGRQGRDDFQRAVEAARPLGIRAERGEPRDDLLTPDERRTLLTLWVIARSPLMVGGDLPSSDPATIALLQNPDVLAVHARSSGNREVFREDPLAVWTAEVTAEDNPTDDGATKDDELDGSTALPVGRRESATAGTAHHIAAFNVGDARCQFSKSTARMLEVSCTGRVMLHLRLP